MGHGFVLSCESCEFEKEIFLGTGMMGFDSVSFIKGLPVKKRERLLSEMEGKEVVEQQMYEELFACEKGCSIQNKPYIKINFSDGSFYEVPYQCYKCKKQMKVVSEEEIIKYACPKCKFGELQNRGFILWD